MEIPEISPIVPRQRNQQRNPEPPYTNNNKKEYKKAYKSRVKDKPKS